METDLSTFLSYYWSSTRTYRHPLCRLALERLRFEGIQDQFLVMFLCSEKKTHGKARYYHTENVIHAGHGRDLYNNQILEFEIK